MKLNTRSSTHACYTIGNQDGIHARAGHSIMGVELSREHERSYWHGVWTGALAWGNGETERAARRHLAGLDQHHGML